MNVFDIPNHIGSPARLDTFEGTIVYDRLRRSLLLRNAFGHIALGYYNSADGFSPLPKAERLVIL